jgi:ATP-dependent helicase/DNAse subunit B
VARQVLLGPILNANRDMLVERCRTLLREGRGREFVYLAASKPLLDRVTDELLEGDIAGTIEPLNVYLLSGFSRRVLAGARYVDGGGPLPYFQSIDREQRPLQKPLLARIMARLSESGELKSFGALARTEGVIASMSALIGEIQRAAKTAAEFRDVVVRRESLDRESKPTREPIASEDEPETDATGNPEDVERRREARRIAALDYDKDTALIYEWYEALLDKHNLTDASRDYLRALSVLRGEFAGREVRVPFLDEARMLVVDGFFDMLPVHAETITVLLPRFEEVLVNLNYDTRNPEVFAPFRDVVERFTVTERFERLETDLVKPVADGLRPLREFLFNPTLQREEGAPMREACAPAITLVTASDRVREVRAVSKLIKESVDEGLQPHEIAVVVRERGSYEAVIRSVFRDEQIALAIDERRPLGEVPAVRASMKIVEAAVANRTRDGQGIPVKRIAGILKTDYFALTEDREHPFLVHEAQPQEENDQTSVLTADEIENAVAFVGLELNLGDWLRRSHRLLDRAALADRARALAIARDMADAGDGEEGADTQTDESRVRHDYPPGRLRLARTVIEAVGQVILSIPYEAPPREMARAFRSALRTLGLRRGLERTAASAFPDTSALRRAALDLRGLDALERALDSVVDASELVASHAEPSASVTLTRGEFRADLERAVSSQEFLVAATTEGGVRLLSATDLRGLTFHTVMILGLVEGEFPDRARGDWIYPQHERDNLKELGLALVDLTPSEALRREEHFFYQAACRATDRLVLCRPLVGDDEAETIASYFIDECATVFGRDRGLETVLFTAGFDGEHLERSTTPLELARSLGRLRRNGNGNPEAVDALGEFAREDRPGRTPAISEWALARIDIELLREGDGFSEFDGTIRSSALRHLLDGAFVAHTFSASELNVYGHCPFRFFALRVLGLRPRVEAALDLQAIEKGVLFHEILRRFFERHRAVRLETTEYARLASDLQEVANEVFAKYERGMPPLNQKLWAIERRTLMLQLDGLLRDELELQAMTGASGPVPTHFELAFGMPRVDGDDLSTPEPLVLRRKGLGDPESLALRGQIDRVDIAPDGTVVAYDYKTSKGPAVRDMDAGRDVQLGVYLAALEDLFLTDDQELAGGGYYSLSVGASRRNNGLYRSDLVHHTKIRSGASSSLTPRDWRETRDRVEATVFRFFDRIREGDFRVSPSLDEKTCAHCDCSSVCRFDKHRTLRKRRAERRLLAESEGGPS